MSLFKREESDGYEWLDEEFVETNYSFIIRENGDFEVYYGRKPIGKVESRTAVDELIAVHKGIS